jgi:heme exporter protein A
MLKVSALGCEWGNQKLFSKLTFEVAPGSALRVSGANGVGKSSLLKILTGLLLPSAGSIFWRGQTVRAGDPFFLSELLYIGHKVGIQPALTPLQNLNWLIGIRGNSSFTQIKFALKAVGLQGFENTPCEVLSKGQCQRVALARLWLAPPVCWILDEPFTGLDETGIYLIREQFLAHLELGGIIVIATHHKIALDPFPYKEIQLGEVVC